MTSLALNGVLFSPKGFQTSLSHGSDAFWQYFGDSQIINDIKLTGYTYVNLFVIRCKTKCIISNDNNDFRSKNKILNGFVLRYRFR